MTSESFDEITFSGALLAGGQSSRFGSDKALADFGGEPLWCHQWATLAEAGISDRTLSARRDQRWVPPMIPVIADAELGLGPLSGIEAALGNTHRTHVLVLAVDLPFITARWLLSLFTRCRPGVGVVPRTQRGYEPLAAIYPKSMHPSLLKALKARQLSLQPIIASAVAEGLLTEYPVPANELPLLRNINRMSDL